MADPLSVAGTAVGIISLGLQVTKGLVDFYTAAKDAKAETASTAKKLCGLFDLLNILNCQIAGRTFHHNELNLLGAIERQICNCDELVRELNTINKKFCSDSTNNVFHLRYPFRQETLQKLGKDIDATVEYLQLALQTLQQHDTQELKLLLDLARADQVSSTIRDWLKAPDVSVEYNAACKKRDPTTGLWLVKGPLFSSWLQTSNSFLWLSGFAGCGKSVLCSTAIQHAFRYRRGSPRIAVAFFFFVFDDKFKQDASAMLRGLILQLSAQLKDNAPLSRLHNSYRDTTPPDDVLAICLQQLIRMFDHVYILLDALDESPRGKHRDGVLEVLVAIRKWEEPGLHILVTSRKEPDIREAIRDQLGAMGGDVLSMENSSVDQDITNYIARHLQENKKLQKWKDHHEHIKAELANRAKGVFRWVECQFRELEKCPRSKRNLDKLLKLLPKSLDETYERMLLKIDDAWVEDTQRMLTLLCCAKRPLTVPELVDAIAVELGDRPIFNPDGRLGDVDAIHDVCPGLIEIDEQASGAPIVRIAHFSVQEYLESGRLSACVAKFAICNEDANTDIARICIIYLLEPKLQEAASWQNEYPLALYCAQRWHQHWHDGKKSTEIVRQTLQLFRNTAQFEAWVSIWNIDHWSGEKPSKVPSPVYYASLLGLHTILLGLLSASATFIIPRGADVNAQGGKYGNALQAASERGHEAIVRLLLEKGADVNEKGADVNAQGSFYGNALQAASKRGHEVIVRLLLEKGADVNAQGGFYGNALHAASKRGHEAVVRLLLEKGADVNAQGGFYGNALQAASEGGHEAIVRLILEKGADVNAQGGFYGNALQAASNRGHEAIVRLLLEKGADVNAQGGEYRNALQIASNRGHEAIVRLLLEKGADVNAQGGKHGNALQAASERGHEAIVRLLLDKGADVNAQGGFNGNALHAASERGHEAIVRLLLEKGADVNAQGGFNGNALQAASKRGHEAVVRLLLDKGADVNAQGGEYGNALAGHQAMVRLFLRP
ncbi:Ankyrin repeat-containing domain protein [Rhypophila sp. PSN 637]